MFAIIALAGCLSDDTSDPTTDETGRALTPLEMGVRPMVPEELPITNDPSHNHADVTQHQFLWNYEMTGRDSLLTTEVTAAGLHALDVQAGHLFGAVYGSNAVSVNGGVAIWNLDNPESPQLEGQWRIPGAVGGDRSIGATTDGNYVVLSTEALSCFGHVNPDPFRVYLLDVTDKSNPFPADLITIAGPSIGAPTATNTGASTGEHSVWVDQINGIDYAFIQGQIFEIERSEGGARFVDTGSSLSVGHDMYVKHTPWNTTWALTANGGNAFNVYNITDVYNPVEIASWDIPDRDTLPESYYLHTAEVAFFEDQIIFVVTSEDWQDHPSSMWMIDGSELLNHPDETVFMEIIGQWTNPEGLPATNIKFSMHNPRMSEEGIMSLSMYHGGIWQFDFRHEDFRADPAEIGWAVYAEGTAPTLEDPVFDTVESQLCGLGIEIDTPTYMDVELGPNGILYAADVHMGMYAFTPTADHPVYGSLQA